MKPSIAAKLDQLSTRLEEINRLPSPETVTAHMDTYRRWTREHAELGPVVELYRRYQGSAADLKTAQEMASDPAMRDFADAEVAETRTRLEGLETELQKMLLPRDPNDERNIFLEVRAGTGGDESALFAAELFRMYARYAERKRWQVEVISESGSDLGGVRA